MPSYAVDLKIVPTSLNLLQGRVTSTESQNPIGRAPDFTYTTLVLMNAATPANGVYAFVVETKEYFERVAGVWVSRGSVQPGAEIQASQYGWSTANTGANNNAALGRAITAANARGGARIMLGTGLYQWTGTQQLFTNIELCGEGSQTIIRTAADTTFFYTATGGGLKGIALRNFILRRENVTTTTYHVDLVDTVRAIVENVEFMNYEWVNDPTTGVPTTTFYSTIAGLRFRSTYAVGVDSFMTLVKNCWFPGSTIYAAQTDSRIEGCYCWGQSRSASVIIDAPNVSVINSDFIPSKINGGIYVTANGKWAQITGGNRFDGSYNSIPTGWGVVLDTTQGVLVSDNSFYQCCYGAVTVINGDANIITGNTFLDNNRINDPACTGLAVDGIAYPDVLLTNTSGNIVANNVHKIVPVRSRASGGGAANALKEVGSGRNIMGSWSAAGTYLYPGYLPSATSGSPIGAGVRSGLPEGITLGAGIITIAGAVAYTVVQHRLGYLPRNVQLTSRDARKYFVDTMTVDHMVIYTDAVPTGTNASFYWRAE